MVKNKGTLRLFVAMPGKSMGEYAKWKDPEQIKAKFYRIIERELKDSGYDAHLFIEMDKDTLGPVHPSMYNEASIADVYIADLTGNNPNVYFELAVRWC